MRRIRLLAALAALAALAGVLAAGCGRRDPNHPPTAREGAPLAVTIVKVGVAGGGSALTLPARVEASEEVTLTARVAGTVTRFPVREGGSFRAGDPLAMFDAPEARAALAAAEAGHAAAQSRRALAARQEARMESLYAERVVALNELERAQDERRAADAALAQAEAARAEWSASTRTPAPFDGVVIRHRVDEGTLLSGGEPLVDIRSSATSTIAAAVPEGAANRLEKGGSFEYQVGDAAWRPAALVRVEGMIDPATRSKVARFRPVGRGERLEAGAFARVRLASVSASAGTEAPAMTVPRLAVVRRGALTGVYLARDGRAALRWVNLGRDAGSDVAVLAGLEPGDSVIADPSGVEDGRAIVVRP